MSSHINYSDIKRYISASGKAYRALDGNGIVIENPCRSDFIWVNDEKQLEEFADDLIGFGERLKQEAKVSK